MRRYLPAVAFGTAVIAATPAAAQTADDLGKIAVELGQLAILVVFVELAMSLLFNWRVYRAGFNHRALKTPIMVVVGLLIVLTFKYDVFARVLIHLDALALVPPESDPDKGGNWLTALISALVIAGGSSGINTLFLNLGIRSPLPDRPPEPARDEEAWFSVKVNGAVPDASFYVDIADSAKTDPALAGSLVRRRFWQRVSDAWGYDPNRFPNYGGKTVKSGKGYKITLLNADMSKAADVYEGSFAPRAIIDFNVKV